MKWQRAKRVNLLIVVAMVLVGLGTLAFKLYPATSALPRSTAEGSFQMGFYDLMSQQKEIYDVRLQTTRGMIMTTITNPNDNRFMLKGKFTPTQKKHGRIYFNLTPIYYSTEQKGLMIDGLVDLLIHKKIQMWNMDINGQRLFVWQTGGIFLPPQ